MVQNSVIWDTRLLPVRCNVATRSYQTAMTPHQSKKISFREAAKFFTTYISRDMSRKLYEAYIAIADRHNDGVFNGDCIYLSLQMSRALGKLAYYRRLYLCLYSLFVRFR